jgi:hypothetical protein
MDKLCLLKLLWLIQKLEDAPSIRFHLIFFSDVRVQWNMDNSKLLNIISESF